MNKCQYLTYILDFLSDNTKLLFLFYLNFFYVSFFHINHDQGTNEISKNLGIPFLISVSILKRFSFTRVSTVQCYFTGNNSKKKEYF